jgi:signal-transduction protein with cAMP-binding, CBS, and nucleotidyltransferase domain
MNFMLSAKSSDITTWRTAESFAAAYRQAVLAQASSEHCDSSETLFFEVCATLDAAIVSHQELLKQLNILIEEVSSSPLSALKELTDSFYSLLYRHFAQFHSAPTFYQFSMLFLQKITSSIIRQITDQLIQTGHHFPEITLIALGPAGRAEYSPYCQLQIMLVHNETSRQESIDLFCDTLHSGFEESGIAVDPLVTPRNAAWRGTLAEWQLRCQDGLQSNDSSGLINLCRLVDQYPLYNFEGLAGELKQITSAALGSHSSATSNLIERMAVLSNGLGIMGRLKLEKSGSENGLFRLLDHGLIPFSAALSALTLIYGILAVGSCERISELLKRGKLDVVLAEQMLATWHTLHGLRLRRDQSNKIVVDADHSLCLNPKELTAQQLQSLTGALESVAIIQRHVKIVFFGIEE